MVHIRKTQLQFGISNVLVRFNAVNGGGFFISSRALLSPSWKYGGWGMKGLNRERGGGGGGGGKLIPRGRFTRERA